MKNLILISVLSLVLCTACIKPEDNTDGIIPEPANIEYNRGKLIIKNNSKIYISGEELRPLAKILQSSIQSISGLSPEITSTRTGKNNIELIIKDNYDPEEYELKISENASLYASGYNSVAFGLSSLVQLMRMGGKEISLPRLSIKDKPAYEYRAVLIDLARFWHPVESVEETIDLLWFYKIRYLHLHLSDNRRMTFPLDDYPELKTINADGGREYYTREELDKLVEYARQRGVIIIPEIEFPGHSGQLYQKYPETFGSVDPATGKARPLYAVNIAKEETYEACGEIIKSLAEVFYTSPYIHIVGDEVYLENIKRLPEYKSFCLEKNLTEAADGNAQELFCHFINRMHEVVRECGKETIIWEGFPGSGAGSEQISKDIKVIVWNTTYNHPDTLIAGGFKIINSTWMPWYMVGAMNFAPSVERALDWEVTSWRHWRTDIPDI
ncbi:MAG: family 20 glycosylhydrolase, partial [Bacteroidales bacterium]|nr:family 20 glycosylhydrolase [Bacteroidales bacterium]